MYIFLSLNCYFEKYFEVFLVSNPNIWKLSVHKKLSHNNMSLHVGNAFVDFSKVNLCSDWFRCL